MTDITNPQNHTPEELIKLGEQIYFQKKDELEKEHLDEFAVIEVDSGDIFIKTDKVSAIQEAQAKHPTKLFYIVQIGNLKQPSSNVNEVKRYAWPL